MSRIPTLCGEFALHSSKSESALRMLFCWPLLQPRHPGTKPTFHEENFAAILLGSNTHRDRADCVPSVPDGPRTASATVEEEASDADGLIRCSVRRSGRTRKRARWTRRARGKTSIQSIFLQKEGSDVEVLIRPINAGSADKDAAVATDFMGVGSFDRHPAESYSGVLEPETELGDKFDEMMGDYQSRISHRQQQPTGSVPGHHLTGAAHRPRPAFPPHSRRHQGEAI
ncbi:hypothetical protein R3P38DRAFT_2804711 [Favolaschia claudopus]|uniref:Uncharacterized protein n=1 Tax=Favolaschia claudopus TaxID=2862362 RepID=A0AAV9ZP58_9AGAR